MAGLLTRRSGHWSRDKRGSAAADRADKRGARRPNARREVGRERPHGFLVARPSTRGAPGLIGTRGGRIVHKLWGPVLTAPYIDRADLPAFPVEAYRAINSVEIALVVTIVFVAAFMARGAWLF
jgi:hypothetical protein